ncbi:hypothetical protein SAMN04487996_111248 [Dyadobacter soli]|uniref:Cytochrome c domain-containing protein n=1 Tax=Dyadobacter soli TaxID=659014 RepID=A0A1G7MFE5_9BACT|nr:hypothetical protein [Dyadobacter soli]SDF60421.1 hypothetical protein SAMN04487996_111248 [Dyadobacter soli]
MKKIFTRRPGKVIVITAITFVFYVVEAGRSPKDALTDVSSHDKALPTRQVPSDAADRRANESKKAFLEAYRVFMHPRCMNCHPKGDTPFQGDDSHLHPQGVTRGPDGKGLYANKCANCHQPQTGELEGEHMPPSHPTWHLPPAHRKMVFEGKSPRTLAASFKDSSFTGFATMERFIEHVETDRLVRHSFTYGTRPPLSHAEFVAKVKEWIEKGAVLPDK